MLSHHVHIADRCYFLTAVVPNPNPGAKKQYPYAINNVFSEFNTGAFAVSMGLPIISKNLTSPAACPS